MTGFIVNILLFILFVKLRFHKNVYFFRLILLLGIKRSVREPEMVFEMRQLGEALHADMAGVRLLTGVTQFVAVQLGRSWKLLSAVDALVATVVDRARCNGRNGRAFGHLNKRQVEGRRAVRRGQHHLGRTGTAALTVLLQAAVALHHYLYGTHNKTTN